MRTHHEHTHARTHYSQEKSVSPDVRGLARATPRAWTFACSRGPPLAPGRSAAARRSLPPRSGERSPANALPTARAKWLVGGLARVFLATLWDLHRRAVTKKPEQFIQSHQASTIKANKKKKTGVMHSITEGQRPSKLAVTFNGVTFNGVFLSHFCHSWADASRQKEQLEADVGGQPGGVVSSAETDNPVFETES
eukprot:COSAG06_NODE_245_length_19176_cov_167.625151_25_plen_195_part_00